MGKLIYNKNKLKAQLLEIAMCNMTSVQFRGHLEELGNDSEDFIEVPVWGLETALLQAYELGVETGKKKEALK